jgi:hypothetical protein
MNQTASKLLIWAPRVLALCFAGFMAMFATDVFDEHQGVWQTVLALFMHLIPAFVVLAVLALAWTHEWLGSAGYILLAALYAWWALPKHWDWTLYISGPLLLIAALYWMNWTMRRHALPAH